MGSGAEAASVVRGLLHPLQAKQAPLSHQGYRPAAGILATHAAYGRDPHDPHRAPGRQKPGPPRRLPGTSGPEAERAGFHPRLAHAAGGGLLPLLDGKVDAKPLLGQTSDRPIREHRPDGLVDSLDPGGHGRVIFPKGNSYLSL